MSGTPNYPGDIGEVIRRLEARMRDLQTAQATRQAFDRISANVVNLLGRLVVKAGGRLTVENAAGNPLLCVGQIPLNDGSFADGLAVFRPTGEVAMAAFQSGADFLPIIYDRAGNRVILPDETAGQGIARPFLSHPMFETQSADMPGSGSATFITLWTSGFYKQQAGIYLFGRYVSDTATSGQLRVLANGVQIDATVTVPLFTSGTWSVGPVAIPGSHMDFVQIEVQALRNAGAGLVRCAPIMVTTRSL